MKKINLILALIFTISILSAQSKQYLSMMEKTIAQMDTARSVDDFQKIANVFERISNAEQKEWLPNYYFALCQIYMAGLSMEGGNPENMTAYIDQAQKATEHCMTIAPEESEVYALQGYVYTARIWSDPVLGGPKFSPLANEAYGKAIALDTENPRAYFLRGQHVFHTPEFWGGGPKKAKDDLEVADKYFKETAQVSSIHPKWGARNNSYLLSKIQN